MAIKKDNEIKIDGHKLMYHVKEVAKWLDNEPVAPIYIEIGPINSCNHKCNFCALDYLKSKGSAINKTVLINTLENMAKFGVKSVMFGGEGEPLMHPHLSEAIQKAKDVGLDIAITTNGVLFDEKKADSMLKNLSWIKFSIDAGTRKTYAKIHGTREADFDRLIKNIKFASALKKKKKYDVTIGSQIVITSENIKEVEKLIILMKESGAKYLVLKPYSQHPNSINKQIFDLKKYDSELNKLAEKYTGKTFKVIYRKMAFCKVEDNIEFEKCYGTHFFALIDANGNIIPCNIFYEKNEFIYGNINKESFENIWKSERRKEVLKKLDKMGCKDCRKGCRLTFVNKYLNDLKTKNVRHINFI